MARVDGRRTPESPDEIDCVHDKIVNADHGNQNRRRRDQFARNQRGGADRRRQPEYLHALTLIPIGQRMFLIRNGSEKRKEIMQTGQMFAGERRSEEHTSELQSLMRISYAVFCLKKKT